MTLASPRSFSQRIALEGSDAVRVHLSGGAEAVRQEQGEVVLDLNDLGNWVRGFEVIGGFVPFSVERAVSPFCPVRPAFPSVPMPGTVTYDPEADAAFVYLEYNASFNSLEPQKRTQLSAVSHSVNTTATYALDERGGLVWVRIPIADLSGTMDRLVELLRT